MKLLDRIENHISNQKGSALAVVLMVLVIVSIIGVALVSVTVTNFKLSVNEREFQSSFYIAEAGLNYKVNDIENEVVDFYNNTDTAETFFSQLENYFSSPTILNSFEETFGKDPEANVSVTLMENVSENERRYAITSEGIIGNRTRTAVKEIVVQWVSKGGQSILTDMAIFSNTSISVPNGTIIGPVGTNSSQAGSITLSGGGSIDGEIFVGPGGGEDVVDAEDWINHSNPQAISEIRDLSMPPTPSHPPELPLHPNKTISENQWNSHDLVKDGNLNIDHWLLQSNRDLNTLVLDGNYQLNKITAKNNYILNIDLNGKDRIIVVNELNMTNGHLKIVGDGKLSIYVLDKINFGSSSTMNQPESGGVTQSKVEQLEIVYKGTDPISLGGGQEIYGSIFSEYADINLGGGSSIHGTIVTGGSNIKLDGGTNAVVRTIYAPMANIKIEAGANVKGSIIGKSVEMSGGAHVIHDPMDNIDIPFFPPGSDDIEAKDLIKENTPIREI